MAIGLEPAEANKLDTGPVIGLVVGGPNIIEICMKVFSFFWICFASINGDLVIHIYNCYLLLFPQLLEEYSFESNIYISPDASSAAKQASSFFQCAAMHLGC